MIRGVEVNERDLANTTRQRSIVSSTPFGYYTAIPFQSLPRILHLTYSEEPVKASTIASPNFWAAAGPFPVMILPSTTTGLSS